MNLSAPFIRRPVGTTLLTIAVAIAGAIAFSVLPVAPLPQVDFPTISVRANLPGASAQIMAASVATPLERQFSHIAGITEMTSSSSLGSTSVTLQFDLSRNIDGAARDVQAAINAARTYLPTNLPQNPSYHKVNPADAPIMILGLTSNKYPVTRLYDLASTILEQKLSQINGVGQIFVGGGATPSVRVEVIPLNWRVSVSPWATFARCLAWKTRIRRKGSYPIARSAKTSSPTTRSPRRPITGLSSSVITTALQSGSRTSPKWRTRRKTSAPRGIWTAGGPSSSSSSASPALTSFKPSIASPHKCPF